MPQDQELRGSFSKNKKKTADNQPDIKGKIVVRGEKIWLSAWKKESPDGIWYSLQGQFADESAEGKPKPAVEQGITDDDTPW